MSRPAPWILWLLICLGGALGSAARYLLATGMLRWLGPRFPFGTFTVNVSGSFLLAVIAELGLAHGLVCPEVRVVLATGVLGGFTTYSSFNQEALGYFERRAWFLGALYLALTVVGCLAAGAAGVASASWLASVAALPAS